MLKTVVAGSSAPPFPVRQTVDVSLQCGIDLPCAEHATATKSLPTPTFNGRCAYRLGREGSREQRRQRCDVNVGFCGHFHCPFSIAHSDHRVGQRVRSPSKYPSVRCQVLRVHVSPNLVNGSFVAISDFLFLPWADDPRRVGQSPSSCVVKPTWLSISLMNCPIWAAAPSVCSRWMRMSETLCS
jgi:hypothetical protein